MLVRVQGEAGSRAHQQSRVRPADQWALVDEDHDAHVRQRRTISTNLSPRSGKSRFPPRPSARHRGLRHECTRRGVPPPTVTLFGSPFITWRGLPLIPSDKLYSTKPARPTSCCCVRARRSRASSACSSRAFAGRAEPFGAFHGHQPQGGRVLSDLALLFGGRLRTMRSAFSEGSRWASTTNIRLTT